ncbi:MAG: c-type cytochrome [Verrucomicrobiales bacterium]
MKPDPKKSQSSSARVVPGKPVVRNKADENEPSIGHSAMPVWFFAALAILLFWAFVYLDERAGGFHPQVYGSYTSYQDVKINNPPETAHPGEKVYTSICLPCHGPSGAGAAGQFPPLAGSEWVISEAPDRIARIVMHGLQGPIQVKGAGYNNAMPGFGEALSDQEVAAVLNYIRISWGNAAPEVPVEKITEIRTATQGRNSQWTVQELQGVPGAP